MLLLKRKKNKVLFKGEKLMYKFNENNKKYEKINIKNLKVLDKIKINLEDDNFSVVIDEPKKNEANIWTVKIV